MLDTGSKGLALSVANKGNECDLQMRGTARERGGIAANKTARLRVEERAGESSDVA